MQNGPSELQVAKSVITNTRSLMKVTLSRTQKVPVLQVFTEPSPAGAESPTSREWALGVLQVAYGLGAWEAASWLWPEKDERLC